VIRPFEFSEWFLGVKKTQARDLTPITLEITTTPQSEDNQQDIHFVPKPIGHKPANRGRNVEEGKIIHMGVQGVS